MEHCCRSPETWIIAVGVLCMAWSIAWGAHHVPVGGMKPEA